MNIFTRYGAKRLLKLADILAVADKTHKQAGKPGYDQGNYAHHCGAPACALGHYAVHTPQRFKLDSYFGGVVDLNGNCVYDDSPQILKEFGIDEYESDNIFGGWGCGDAQTGKEAAKFIRAFVKRKLKEESHV